MSLVERSTMMNSSLNWEFVQYNHSTQFVGNHNRLVFNGKEYQVIPKTPGEILGAHVLRPLIDVVRGIYSQTSSLISYLNAQLRFIPGATALTYNELTTELNEQVVIEKNKVSPEELNQVREKAKKNINRVNSLLNNNVISFRSYLEPKVFDFPEQIQDFDLFFAKIESKTVTIRCPENYNSNCISSLVVLQTYLESFRIAEEIKRNLEVSMENQLLKVKVGSETVAKNFYTFFSDAQKHYTEGYFPNDEPLANRIKEL